ncbi:hypothetical protein B7494_g2429 [Chlorociboria aeruginascens]|nr:hypothetical protein B7494_g2429 [Chlorociboria aeruginascens]
MTLTESVSGLTSVSSTLLAVTTITIILRFVARYKQNARILMDDWMVVSAWIFFIGLTTIAFYVINTTCAYLIILEAGMTIIAVNLPSLWYYTLIMTRENFFRLTSFGSARGSQRFKRSNPSDYPTTGNQSTGEWPLGNGSTENLNLDRSVQGSMETYAMSAMDQRSMAEATMGIRVERTFMRIEEEV